ncbi:MAG: Alpha/beta hydrolase [Deltaproteobacteria bacterium]|nr:Alpha/beta hydrolase [Deltaproteobacteria bacterium]
MSKSDSFKCARRAVAILRTIGLAASLAALTTGPIETAYSQTVANPMRPIPIPVQVPAKDSVAQIPDTRLWYWDTGGNGVPIVLLHPSTGSALIWSYQQPVFAKAGYRVIAYSRRGYYNSAPYDPNNPGVGSEDLRHLADFLGLGRFHVLASAAGGSIASDFAFSYQDRLLSLTISSNSFGVRDGEIAKAAAFIRPKGFEQLPAEFREIGPSYRAANPEGVKAWIELEHKALIGPRSQQTLRNEIKQARLKELKLPTLLIAGSADLYTPPSISRIIAAEIPNSRLVVIPESGHSVYWEQPELFNRAVLDFIGGHKQ